MVVVSAEQAKADFELLLECAEEGEEVIIERAGRTVAKLVRHEQHGKRQFGSWKGRFQLDESFFDPLPEEELRAWEGG